MNVARLLKCDAELALTHSTNKFAGRVKAVETMAAENDRALEGLDAETLDAYWKEAKKAEKGSQQSVL